MHLCLNKKALVKSFLVGILLLTAAFVIILFAIDSLQQRAEERTSREICRTSILLREKTHTEIYDPVIGKVKLVEVASPWFCKTIDKYVPEEKTASKSDIEKEVADLMAYCWEDFGEGNIKDPFKQGDPVTKNCFVCDTVSLRETSKFKGEIKATDFRQYLFETPYKILPKNDNCKIDGGFCINTEDGKDCLSVISADPSYISIGKKVSICQKLGKNSCCYTDYECWNRGGKCSNSNPDPNIYAQYNAWECPSKMKCYVNKENYFTYGNYIQRFGGPGNIIITTDLKPGETYAVSFGSPTGHCQWCIDAGIGGGLGGAAAGGIAAAMAISAIPTFGLGPAIIATASVIIGGVGYVASTATAQAIQVNIIDLFTNRDINTIYLSTLKQIQDTGKDVDYCSVVTT